MSTKAAKFILILLTLGLITIQAFSQEKGVVPGRIRIKFEPSLGYDVDKMQLSKSKGGVIITGFKNLDELNSKYQIVSMQRIFPKSPKFEEKHQKHGLQLWYQIDYTAPKSIDIIVDEFQTTPEIQIAERILERTIEPYEVVTYKGAIPKATKAGFNDPLLTKQWHYNNTGQTGGTPGADISLFDAWNVTTGNSSVIVSVHDQGVDLLHEDLAANIWTNLTEKNGVKGVDDDGNGYIDDINGFNFLNWTGEIEAMDHGTHVAGTISAVNNNGKGVCGVAGGSGNKDGVRIMSCQILGNSGGDIAPSYVYAADNGAIISQNSWGYSSPGYYEQAILDAIDYFIEEAGNELMKGGVVVFAAGNENSTGAHYPGYYKNCVTVAATGHTNKKASYSNYSTNVDISAPGGDGESAALILSTLPNNTYGYLAGTSMACPHVSGIAALIVSKYGSSTFTKEKLLIHLLTSYDEIYDLNPTYLGQLGSGLANASFAMKADEKKKPSTINSLKVLSVAQDFALLNWIAPSDEDDGSASKYVLYYNQDTLIDSKLNQYSNSIIEKKVKAGDTLSVEVNDLKALTKYQFVLIAYDRWGNASALSNKVFTKTNAGPEVRLFPPSITINLNTASSVTNSTIFKIFNDGDGLLRWNATPRHSSSAISTLSFDNSLLKYPISSFNQPNYLHQFDSVKVNSSAVTYAYTPINKKYFTSASYLIGETDTSFTNSIATKFTVTETTGFNLTTVSMYMKHNQETGPVILEIYEGDDLLNAKLLYAQEVNSTSNGDYYHSTTLTEHIFFIEGQTFWIVYHIPSGNLYPLGIGREVNENDSKNCLISFNMGKTWKLLEEEFLDPRWAWAVTASSTLENIGNYISLSSSSDDVLPHTNQTVTVTGNGSKFINGTYKTNIVINTNDSDEPLIRMPVTLNVSGQKPKLEIGDVLEIGTVILGSNKTFQITLANSGLGSFTGATYTFSDPQYSFVTTPTNYIDAQTQTVINLSYKPTVLGSNNSKLTIADNKGNVYIINLFASAVSPPVINLTPASAVHAGLTMGNTATGSFTISNTGSFPLQYYIPSFADGSNLTGSKPAYTHSFGYQYTKYQKPQPEADWVDIASTGNRITDYFKTNTGNYYKINLGFAFPFYGVNQDSVFITNRGILTFDDNSTFNSTPTPNYYTNPHGFISPNWQNYNFLETGEVYYKRMPGKVIVQYSKVGSNSLHTIDIQIVLNDNGNIQIFYGDNYDWTLSQFALMYVFIENPENNDAFIINRFSNPAIRDSIHKFNALYITNPGYRLISGVSKSFGTLPVGESQLVNYNINTGALSEGSFNQKLAIVSNDPNNTVKHFDVQTNIVSGGTPKLTVDRESIDFGQLFVGGSQKEMLSLKNEGSKSITVNSISLKSGVVFSLSGPTSLVFKPKYSSDFEVSVNTSTTGLFSDTLIITTASGPSFKIPVSVNILLAPSISSNVSSIAKSLSYGQSFDTLISITNSGQSPLEFVHNGNEWWNLTEVTAKNLPVFKENSYFWKANNKSGGPIFDWVDITETGKLLTYKKLWGKEAWEKTPLPFKFNFYGKDYDSIYLTFISGIVLFEPKSLDFNFWTGGSYIPDISVPNNYIAPHWGFEGPATALSKTYGVYYQSFEDKFVVLYKGMLDNFGMGPIGDYELILYKDGSIKFQYNFDNGGIPRFDILGNVGVENADGTDGVLIVNRTAFLKDNMSIVLTPSKKYSILPGQTKQFKFSINAGKAFDGVYNDTLSFLNNAPINPTLNIPINLAVKGESRMQNPNSIIFTNIKAYKTSAGFASYKQEFQIKNNGTKIYDITSNKMFKGTETILEIYSFTDIRNGFQWVNAASQISYTLRPNEFKKFRITVTPDTLHAPRTLNDSIVIQGSFDGGKIYIPVKAEVGLPASMTTDKNFIAVYAPSKSYTDTRSFTIGNTKGKGDLNYKVKAMFSREGNYKYTEVFSNSISLLPKSNTSDLDVKLKQLSALNSFNKILEYDTTTAPKAKLGFGGGTAFSVATAFVAPEIGFTLSHVMTYYVPETVKNSEITFRILSGSDINKAIVIYEEKFSHVGSGNDNIGTFLLFKLKEVVDIAPNEQFYLVFIYQPELKYPQGTYAGTTKVRNRHYYFSSVWKDLADASGFETYGYMVKALEETHRESSWLSLSETSGVISPGATKLISINLIADRLKANDNYASVFIDGDDPYNPTDKVDVYMHLNTAPEFISTPNSVLNVAENSKLIINYDAKDLENDSIVFEMVNADPMYSLLNKGGGIATITYSPDFNSSGTKNLITRVKDSYGFFNLDTINIVVADINRAPIPKAMKDVKVSLYDPYYTYNFASYFTDPDGDKLEYSIQNLTDFISTVYQKDTTLMIVPKSLGTNVVTVFVTDNKGIKVSSSFKINVVNESIYFNPPKTFSPNSDGVNDSWSIENPSLYKQCSVQIFDSLGNIVFSNTGFDIQWDGYHNGQKMPVGTYFYTVTFGDGTSKSGSISLIR